MGVIIDGNVRRRSRLAVRRTLGVTIDGNVRRLARLAVRRTLGVVFDGDVPRLASADARALGEPRGSERSPSMPVLTSARTHGSAGPSPAAVAAYAGDGVELQTVTLGLRPVSGAARWTVTGEGAGRSLVFTAKPDGSDLEPVN